MEEVKVSSAEAGQRLDRFLEKRYPDLPKSMVYKGLRKKKIKVNRKRAQFNQILKTGDVLQLFLPPDALKGNVKEVLDLPDARVVFENDDLLVLDKPSGLLSQKDESADQDTLNDRLHTYLQKSGQFDFTKPHSFTPAIAHRLDRNTSGLVLASKNRSMAEQLLRWMEDHTIDKRYLALIEKPVSGKLEAWLKKEDTVSLVSRKEKPGYQYAAMEVIPVAEVGDLFLVECILETGRFHQIRSMLADLGAPLAGDRKYGSKREGNYFLDAFLLDFEKTPLKIGRIERMPDWDFLSPELQDLIRAVNLPESDS